MAVVFLLRFTWDFSLKNVLSDYLYLCEAEAIEEKDFHISCLFQTTLKKKKITILWFDSWSILMSLLLNTFHLQQRGHQIKLRKDRISTRTEETDLDIEPGISEAERERNCAWQDKLPGQRDGQTARRQTRVNISGFVNWEHEPGDQWEHRYLL